MKLNSVNKALLTLLVIASAGVGGRTLAQQKWAGMQFQGQDFLNKMVVAVTKYVGECPGSKFDQVAKYTFRSHVEPAPGLEVLIENISPGARTDKKKPYTVRRYDTAQGAEFAEVKIHDHGKHGKKHLTVLPGKNSFEWKVFTGDFDKKSRTVTGLVDSGKFYIEMENDVRTVQRDIEYTIENYCKQYPTKTDSYGRTYEDRDAECEKHNRYEKKSGYCNGREIVAYDRQENKTGNAWADTVVDIIDILK